MPKGNLKRMYVLLLLLVLRCLAAVLGNPPAIDTIYTP